MKLDKVSYLLLGTSLIINAAIAIVGPFFPLKAEERGVDINIVGYIFSIYPFFFVIVSLAIPKILQTYSKKKVFVVGSVIYALSVIGFGLLVVLNDTLFLIFAFIFRSFQGGSNAAVYTTAYSVFSSMYEGQDIMKINSYFKSTLGIGLVIGLLLGTLLYMIGGYVTPFIVFGSFFLVYIPLIKDYFPDEIDDITYGDRSPKFVRTVKNQSLWQIPHANDIEMRKLSLEFIERNDTDDEHFMSNFHPKQNSDKNNPSEIKDDWRRKSPSSMKLNTQNLKYFSDFTKDADYVSDSPSLYDRIFTQIIVKCFLLAVVFLSLLNFAPAILSKRLSELNVHQNFYALIFAIPCVVPISSILIANKLMKEFNGNFVLIIGTVIMSVGFFVVATDDVEIFLLGISLLGFSAPFAVLPLFPMMTNSINNHDHGCENAMNVLSGLYNSALGIGAILGPLIGANLYYYFGFFATAYWLGYSWIFLSLLLFLTGGWWRVNGSQKEHSIVLESELPDYNNLSFVSPNFGNIHHKKKSAKPKLDNRNF